jgi:hypothetical protein
MDEMPPLPEIERRLLEFLGRAVDAGTTEIGRAGAVAWIFSEDCVFHAGALWIRVPLPAGNARTAAALAGSAASREHGLEARAVGTVGERVYCTMYVPETVADAADHQIRGLKLAVPTKAARLRLATSAWRWRFARFAGLSAIRLDFVMTPLHVARVLAAGRGSGDPD